MEDARNIVVQNCEDIVATKLKEKFNEICIIVIFSSIKFNDELHVY